MQDVVTGQFNLNNILAWHLFQEANRFSIPVGQNILLYFDKSAGVTMRKISICHL